MDKKAFIRQSATL